MSKPGEQWQRASKCWHMFGPPLVPGAEDRTLYQRAIDHAAATAPLAEALLLGVTPQLHALAWPQGTRLRAIDRDAEMIADVWPGDPSLAIHGDWLATGLPSASIDCMLGDGGLAFLPWPHGQRALAGELARIVRPGGVVHLRVFVRPPQRETADTVIADLRAGGIPGLDTLKLRLGAALMDSPGEGVRLHDVWTCLDRAVDGDLDALADALGWDRQRTRAIELYRGSEMRYCFLTADEAIAAFCADGGFTLRERVVPGYATGDRCVHLCFSRAA